MGKTLTEKILGRKAGREVSAGEVVTVSPDYYLSHDNSAAIIGEFKKLGVARVKAPEKIIIILDHIVPAADEKYAQNHKTIREFVAAQGIPNFFDIQHGVCHQVLSEEGFALPGKVIVGSDSHTTTYGAFGAFAAGIGRTNPSLLRTVYGHTARAAGAALPSWTATSPRSRSRSSTARRTTSSCCCRIRPIESPPR